MQANQFEVPHLPNQWLSEVAHRFSMDDPVECLERQEPCIGETGLLQVLRELDLLIINNFSEHLEFEPDLPAPHLDDSLLEHMVKHHVTENPRNFLASMRTCASAASVLDALKEVRKQAEEGYNAQAKKAGLPGVATPEDKASVNAATKVDTVVAQPVTAPELAPQPSGWQPYATAPRDGSLVDLFTTANGGQRILCVRYVRAVEVNDNYKPGGCWENLAQDGWRRSICEDAVFVDTGFSHWRLAATDRPPGF